MDQTKTVYLDELPAKGDWPCQCAIPGKYLPPRLISFLYLLVRDELPAGRLEEMLIQVKNDKVDTEFTNPHLERLARAHASYLLESVHASEA